MDIGPTLATAVSARSESILKAIGTNARAAVQAADVRALDRLFTSESHAPARQAAQSVPVHPTRGHNVDMYV
jgi:hypothetical protein